MIPFYVYCHRAFTSIAVTRSMLCVVRPSVPHSLKPIARVYCLKTGGWWMLEEEVDRGAFIIQMN